MINTTQWNDGKRLASLGVTSILCLGIALCASLAGARTAADQPNWNDYLDHAYIYSAADENDLRGLLERTTLVVGRSLSEYHAETFPALAAKSSPMSEAQLRRKAISELLLHRIGDRPSGLGTRYSR